MDKTHNNTKFVCDKGGLHYVLGTMKNIDIKSLIIGALFTSTVIFGVAAVSGPASGKVKLDGPVDVRLSFGSSRPSSSNTSTPTELQGGGAFTPFHVEIKHSGRIAK
jgi:hypothetical protein